MQIIPVIDLLGGRVVHAVKGDRQSYQPVKTVLCHSHDPITIAAAFRDRLRLQDIYIADLDAIQSAGCHSHKEVIAILARRERINILLDAGVSDIENARAWLDLGIRKIVIGSETLNTWDALQNIPALITPARLVFSLDLRSGRILSPCTALAALTPMEALKNLRSAGWREIILLDLKRVGSEEGADNILAARARSAFPDLNLLIGGGIANPEQLIELEATGIAGVLIATALHRGIIRPEHISQFVASSSF
jgi:phosphoribosylformimino-5-aminoimidazole carboxamide ribotide isomerase